MAATALVILWRNPLPIWARPVEKCAGALELVKTPGPQLRAAVDRIIRILSFASANWSRESSPSVKSIVQTRRNRRANARGPRERAAFTSSAVR